MIKKYLQISFCIFLFHSNVFTQLDLKISTNKSSYNYGEIIYITCSVTNISDSTVIMLAPCYDSYQAEFEFNDYYSSDWTTCLATSQELVFQPNRTRNYSWIIDPEIFGLPDKDVEQRIIGHYFYQDLKDTIYISAPLFLGGQVWVGFTQENDSLLIPLRDSLNVNVLKRVELIPTIDSIHELWQIYGYQIDSLFSQLNNDNRFKFIEYNRMIMYDSIYVTSVKQKSLQISDFYLSNAYPNPFNPRTRIQFSVPNSDEVIIKVYNLLGEELNTLINEYKQAGTYEVEFNANNLPSGIYYYRMISGSYSESKKMILLR